MTDLVNEAVRALLAEDAEDLAALNARKDEPALSFDAFVEELKERGRL